MTVGECRLSKIRSAREREMTGLIEAVLRWYSKLTYMKEAKESHATGCP